MSMHEKLFRIVRRFLVEPVRMWYLRHETQEQLNGLGACGKGIVVSGPTRLGDPSRLQLGEGVSINPGFTVRGMGPVTIGNHVHFGQQVLILTSNHNYFEPETLPYDKVRLPRAVTIGDCVWVGDRVTIVPGVTVGEGAVLAAGAVVTRDVPPMAVVGGAPAKVLKCRDEDAYRKLKEAGAYLGWPQSSDLVNKRPMQITRRKRGVQHAATSQDED